MECFVRLAQNKYKSSGAASTIDQAVYMLVEAIKPHFVGAGA